MVLAAWCRGRVHESVCHSARHWWMLVTVSKERCLSEAFVTHGHQDLRADSCVCFVLNHRCVLSVFIRRDCFGGCLASRESVSGE